MPRRDLLASTIHIHPPWPRVFNTAAGGIHREASATNYHPAQHSQD